MEGSNLLRRRRAAAAAGGAVGVAWVASLLVAASLRRARGTSMAPTLHDGQLVVVVPARLRAPRVGDVVVARDPRNPRARSWIKRIAVAGPAVHAAPHPVLPGRTVDLLVDDDEVLLLGDNPAASTDGRHVGATPRSAVTHVVVWPRT